MDLSIVIVSWNSAQDLVACINSLSPRKAGLAPLFEIIVVDNASSDDTVARIVGAFPDVKLIRNEKNRGFAAASNQGILASTGRYILLLNPDSLVAPGVPEGIVSFMNASPEVGVCGCKLLESDGSLQFSSRRFPTIQDTIVSIPGVARLLPNNHYQRRYLMMDWTHDAVREVDWVSGACLAARREAIAEVGLLDEDFFMYCEDMDWCLRMHAGGWRVCYLPHLTVTHHRGASSCRVPLKMIAVHHASMWKYAQKHLRGRWPVSVFAVLTAVGMAARALPLLAAALWPRLYGCRSGSKELAANAAHKTPE